MLYVLRRGEAVDESELEHLGRMLYFADQAYEGESEATLAGRLAKLGAASTHAHGSPTSACQPMATVISATCWVQTKHKLSDTSKCLVHVACNSSE